jgi:hypothetical protein
MENLTDQSTRVTPDPATTTAEIDAFHVSSSSSRVGEISEYSFIPFKTPFSMIISGSSFSGKTTFLYKLLLSNKQMLDPPPKEILYCYLTWQDIYEEIQSSVQNVSFYNGIPSKSEIESFTEDGQPRLLILDDLMTQLGKCPDVVDFFTVFVHHRSLSVFLVLQNIFYQGAKNYLRDISLNVQGMILFKNMRSPHQINILGSQLFPGEKRKYFMDAYEKAVSRKFNYLFVNINPKDSDGYQLMTDILPDQNTIVFLPK